MSEEVIEEVGSEEQAANDFFASLGHSTNEEASDEVVEDSPDSGQEEVATPPGPKAPDLTKAEESFYKRVNARKQTAKELEDYRSQLANYEAQVRNREAMVEAILAGVAKNQASSSEEDPYEGMDEDQKQVEVLRNQISELQNKIQHEEENAARYQQQQEFIRRESMAEAEFINDVQTVEQEWAAENPTYYQEVADLKAGLAMDLLQDGTPKNQIGPKVTTILKNMAKQSYSRNIHPCRLISYHSQKYKGAYEKLNGMMTGKPAQAEAPKQTRSAAPKARKALGGEQRAMADGAAGSLSQGGRSSGKGGDAMTLDAIIDSGLTPNQVKDIFQMGGKNAFMKIAAAVEQQR